MVSNLEATGKANLMTSTDTNVTTPKTVKITNQNADLPFSKSALNTAAKDLHVVPFAISNNISVMRKSSESTFRTGKVLFGMDLNVCISMSTNVYKILKTTITFCFFSAVRTLTVITSASVNCQCSVKFGFCDRTPATSQHYEHTSKP